MKTLIELYDKRPLENVLSTEVFRPERTVFICPRSIASDTEVQKSMRKFFAHRGIRSELEFVEGSFINADTVARCIEQTVSKYPDCAIDIAGGSEASLFAAGTVCAGRNIPVFTYSRRRNTFFNISNAPFADGLKCDVSYGIEDSFLMAGGHMRSGRVDNGILEKYDSLIYPFFDVFIKNRRGWKRAITFIQRISQTKQGEAVPLRVKGGYVMKGERGSRIEADEKILRALRDCGMIRDLRLVRGESVEFTFADHQIRTWLRDVGSVLELYVYKLCMDSGVFDDVKTSVIVDWDDDKPSERVSNELDVMASRGVVPVFISCMTCEVSTEALNELAILRDRFGSGIARSAIVTTEKCRSITRHRASELGIEVIDYEDISRKSAMEHIRNLGKDPI